MKYLRLNLKYVQDMETSTLLKEVSKRRPNFFVFFFFLSFVFLGLLPHTEVPRLGV